MKEEKNIIKPDFLSLTTHQLTVGFSKTNTIFSTASGFLYKHQGRIFLITNWHNVSGVNPITGKLLSDHGGIPDVFATYLRLKNEEGSSLLSKIFLYNDEEMTSPKWLVHPRHKEHIDVVALELEKSEQFAYYSINDSNFDESVLPEVGDDCFVIGYPFKELRYIGLPIWKRASIASEPTVNEDNLPKILIDTATRSGLSGSPVVYQRTGIHNMINGILKDDTIIGRIRGFLGVYSGRVGKGEIHAQLGIVWKKKVINEIIEGKIYGDIEFQKGKHKTAYGNI